MYRAVLRTEHNEVLHVLERGLRDIVELLSVISRLLHCAEGNVLKGSKIASRRSVDGNMARLKLPGSSTATFSVFLSHLIHSLYRCKYFGTP